MQWLYRLERKFGRYAIPNLMVYICLTMLAVFLLDAIVGIPVSSLISLNRAALLRGQVWRLLTFIFVPPASGVITILFALYFYYFIGSGLESAWGAFQFNVYYLCGMLGAIIAALVSGWGNNTYLNLSLFLAFAQLFPDHQVLLFFFIPVKVKYLAYLDWALFALSFITGLLMRDWSTCMAIIMSLLNFFLFFGPGFMQRMRDRRRFSAVRRNWKNQMRNNQNRF